MEKRTLLTLMLTLLLSSCKEEEFTIRFFNQIQLNYPGDGAILDNGCLSAADPITWEFRWETPYGAEQYELYVISENATEPLIDYVLYETNYYYYCDGCYIPNDQKNWKWKVRAMINGRYQPWSEERNFEVENVDTDC